MLSGEGTKTKSIVSGLARSRLDSMIYHTRFEHANNFTTDAVKRISKLAHGFLEYNSTGALKIDNNLKVLV